MKSMVLGTLAIAGTVLGGGACGPSERNGGQTVDAPGGGGGSADAASQTPDSRVYAHSGGTL